MLDVLSRRSSLLPWLLAVLSVIGEPFGGTALEAQTGTVGTLRREVGAVVYRRLWGRGFTTSALASYLRLDTLQNSVQKGSLDGYTVGLDASYTSRSAWGCSVQVRRLQQEQTSGRTLDYEQAFVAVTFTPR